MKILKILNRILSSSLNFQIGILDKWLFVANVAFFKVSIVCTVLMDISVEDDIEGKYKSATKILHALQDLLEQLETGVDRSVMMQGRIATNLNGLSRLTQSMQQLKNQLPSSKRELWLMYVEREKTSLFFFLNKTYPFLALY